MMQRPAEGLSFVVVSARHCLYSAYRPAVDSLGTHRVDWWSTRLHLTSSQALRELLSCWTDFTMPSGSWCWGLCSWWSTSGSVASFVPRTRLPRSSYPMSVGKSRAVQVSCVLTRAFILSV